MKQLQQSPPKLTVIVHSVRSILNVGAIFRTSDAVGAGMVWLTGYTPGPDTHAEKMAKTALGAQLSVPWGRAHRVGDLLRTLRMKNVEVVALEQSNGSLDYREFKPKFPIAVLVGSEIKGIRGVSHNLIDRYIEIPMRGEKESLNVAIALGIALYELTRRWK